MSSEGRYEIEAAKNRLAAAKTQVSSSEKMMTRAQAMLLDARKMMDAAEKMRQAAQLQLGSSKEEMKAAQSSLAAAEKRWEVIEIDDQSTVSPDPEERSKKRRKVSISPTEKEQSRAALERIFGKTAVRSSIERVLRVEVQGCGTPEANGTYARAADRSGGAPMFVKRVRWNGKNDSIIIYRGEISKNWFIGLCGAQVRVYRSKSVRGNSPALQNWVLYGEGASPPPQVKLFSRSGKLLVV